MNRKPIATVVFALVGTALLVIAAVLGLLGSFAFIAIAAVGCFFIAAALVAHAIRSPLRRVATVISVAGIALVVFGMVATPLFYLGWACLGMGLVGLGASAVVTGDLRSVKALAVSRSLIPRTFDPRPPPVRWMPSPTASRGTDPCHAGLVGRRLEVAQVRRLVVAFPRSKAQRLHTSRAPWRSVLGEHRARRDDLDSVPRQ